MSKVAWDISHQEFTIEDHYYFSILKRKLSEVGAIISEVTNFKEITKFDVLVLNYPEKSFALDDVKLVRHFIEKGGRVIALGYYNNEDSVADTINSLAERFGLKLMSDEITDDVNNINNDKYFVVTSKVRAFNKNVKRVLMPCTASVKILSDKGYPIVIGENTAKASSGNNPIIGAEVKIGKGEFILLGTCVFWDNYSITKCDNLQFSLNLLTL
mgnify:CR=1 FL=1